MASIAPLGLTNAERDEGHTTYTICHLRIQGDRMMKCQDLAQQIEAKHPGASPQDVARLCLLLSTQVEDLQALAEPGHLDEAWKKASLRLQLATDQHAAMTDELEQLASSDPRTFNQEQIWVLVRAIKVQSQVLEMYIGQAALDV